MKKYCFIIFVIILVLCYFFHNKVDLSDISEAEQDEDIIKDVKVDNSINLDKDDSKPKSFLYKNYSLQSYLIYLESFIFSKEEYNNLDFFILFLIPSYLNKAENFIGSVNFNINDDSFNINDDNLNLYNDKDELQMSVLVEYRERLVDELIYILEYLRDLKKYKRIRLLINQLDKLLDEYIIFIYDKSNIKLLYEILFNLDTLINNISINYLIKKRCDDIIVILYRILTFIEEEDLFRLLGFSNYICMRDMFNYKSLDIQEKGRKINITFSKILSTFKELIISNKDIKNDNINNNNDINNNNNDDINNNDNNNNNINNNIGIDNLKLKCSCQIGCFCSSVNINFTIYKCNMIRSPFTYELRSILGRDLEIILNMIKKYTKIIEHSKNIFQYITLNYKEEKEKCKQEINKILEIFERNKKVVEEINLEINKRNIKYNKISFNLFIDVLSSINSVVPRICEEMIEKINYLSID